MHGVIVVGLDSTNRIFALKLVYAIVTVQHMERLCCTTTLTCTEIFAKNTELLGCAAVLPVALYS